MSRYTVWADSTPASGMGDFESEWFKAAVPIARWVMQMMFPWSQGHVPADTEHQDDHTGTKGTLVTPSTIVESNELRKKNLMCSSAHGRLESVHICIQTTTAPGKSRFAAV